MSELKNDLTSKPNKKVANTYIFYVSVDSTL